MLSKRYSVLLTLSALVCLTLCGVAGAWTVDLDINAVAEADEETVGGYVALNDDDDNSNSTADKDEAGAVTGEDDLVELWLSRSPGDNVGTITLSATAGGTKVKVWTTATKGTQVSLPKTWDLTSENIPSVLYVEGVAVSGAERDVELKLAWSNETDPCEDKVKITILQVDLDASGLADKDEESVGVYVVVNSDDDNSNGTIDKDDTGTVTGEDDLLTITLQEVLPTALAGTVTLSAPSGGNLIKVWENSTKGTEVTLPKTYNTPADLPKTLYVEGITASSSLRDVELKLSYTKQGTTFGDIIKITVVMVDVTRIKFDHAVGHAADGIDIQENASTEITVPEWVKGGQNKPGAYTKSTNVTIKARLTVSPNSITSAKVLATTADAILGNLGEQTITFASGVSTPEYVSFTPANATPGAVGKGTVTWQWRTSDIQGSGSEEADINSSGPHTIYTVLATPTAPMAEPWTEVLDKSCVWANGQTTATGAAGKVTDSIYTSGYEYDNVSGASQYYDGGDFDLTECLSEWGDDTCDINCWDCAQMVAIFSNALGCTLQTYRITCSCGGGGRGYLLNQIKPIGRDWTNDPFTSNCRNLFAYHMTAWPNIYDACLQVDSDGNPIMQPCTGEQPKNMAFGDYRDKFVDPGDKTWVSGAVLAPASVK